MPMAPDELQFQTAESSDKRRRCAFCKSVLTGSYYQVAGFDACTTCAESRQAAQDLPDSQQKFLKALLYGGGAALAGLIVWSAVSIVTGLKIGLLAIAVGWMVGTAIRKGTGGHTSRKYQLLAIGLTYLAISMSFLPMLIAETVKQKSADTANKNQKPADVKKQEAPKVVAEQKTPLNPLTALVILFGVCLISPFLEAFGNFPGGLIGLFILFLALQQAWSLVKPDDAVIMGPYELPVEEAT